jgi:hypothetical protein
MSEVWDSAQAYERYVGRWSRRVAVRFLRWLPARSQAVWRLSAAGPGRYRTRSCPPSSPAASSASTRPSSTWPQPGSGSSTSVSPPGWATLRRCPLWMGSSTGVVSALVLNFVADPPGAVAEMRRVTNQGRVTNQRGLGPALPPVPPEAVAAAVRCGRLTDVWVGALEIPTVFADFDDFWRPLPRQAGSRSRLLHDALARRTAAPCGNACASGCRARRMALSRSPREPGRSGDRCRSHDDAVT